MNYSTYQETIAKLTNAKASHSEFIDTLISTAIKFAQQDEEFQQEHLPAYSEMMNTLQKELDIEKELTIALPLFISTEVNSPVAFQSLKKFFQTRFIPELRSIKNNYVKSFDSNITNLLNAERDLLEHEQMLKNAESDYQKHIEKLEKHHDVKKFEDQFNTEAFQYKNFKQAVDEATDEYNLYKFIFENICSKFLDTFEKLEEERSIQLRIIFNELVNILNEGIEHSKGLLTELERIYNSLDGKMDYDEIIKCETLRGTRLPHHPDPYKPGVSFNFKEFLNPTEVFAPALSETYAISKINILVNQVSLAAVGQRITLHIQNGEYILYNADRSIQTRVFKDSVDIPGKFKRFIAKAQKDDIEEIVCVIEIGEVCECLNMLYEIEMIPAENIHKI